MNTKVYAIVISDTRMPLPLEKDLMAYIQKGVHAKTGHYLTHVRTAASHGGSAALEEPPKKPEICRHCQRPIRPLAEFQYASPLIGGGLSYGASGPDRDGKYIHGSPWQCLAAAELQTGEDKNV